MSHRGAGNEWRKALATDLRGFSRILLCGSYSDLGLSVGIRVDPRLIGGGRLVIFFAVPRLPSAAPGRGAHSKGRSVGELGLSLYNYFYELPYLIDKTWF
jgi:hypothetical protein